MGCCCSDSKSNEFEERRFLDDVDSQVAGGGSHNKKNQKGSSNSHNSNSASRHDSSSLKKGGSKASSGGQRKNSPSITNDKNPSFGKEELVNSSLPKPGGQISTVYSSCKGSALERLPLFQKLAYIGQGSFAEVTLARKIKTGNLYAMKKIRKKLIEERGEIEHAVTERRLLGELQHPFLVQLHESFQSQQCLYLLLSYAAGGDCHALLSRSPRQTLKATFFYVYEISLALEFLHQSSFLYRDLKPENILIDELGHVLLTDFGVAKKMTAERTESFCGTLLYAAPEVHKNEGQTFAVDWWSLGCFLFEMINGRRPFDSSAGEMQQIRSIVEKDVIVREGEDFRVREEDYSTDEEKAEATSAMEALKELTLQLLCRDPTKRLGGADVFLQPFFHHRYFSLVYSSALGEVPSEGWMEVVEGKGLTPPFQPSLASSVDVQYFTQACPVVMSKKERLSVVSRSASTSVATVGNTSIQSHSLAPYFDVDDDGALMFEQGGILTESRGGASSSFASGAGTQGSSNTSYGRPTEGQSTPSPAQRSISALESPEHEKKDGRDGREAYQTTGGGYEYDNGRYEDGVHPAEVDEDGNDDENDLLKYRVEQGGGAVSNLSYAEEDGPSFSVGNDPPSHYYQGFTFKEKSTLSRERQK